MHNHAAILGAGAAGLFCAGLLAQRGFRVCVLDHAPAPGRKILISGGGRANFTHLHSGPEHFLSQNPHFAKSALARYTPQQFVTLVERHGIAYHAKTPGQLFCDGSARQLVDMLLAEAQGTELRLGTEIAEVQHEPGRFTLHLKTGPPLVTEKLIVATGGLSIPKLGATGFGYRIAEQFGLQVVPPRPALVPFIFAPEDLARFESLAGISTEARLSLALGNKRRPAQQFRDKLLFTHRGLSGPAALQISSYWREGATLAADLAPEQHLTAPLLNPGGRRDASSLANALAAHLPRRLAERLAVLAPSPSWTNPALAELEQRLHAWPLTPAGTEGYPKAEVTAGGVSTQDLHAHSLESKSTPGLYFLGEVVDVTGHLGGHNFHWAWASAYAAAEDIAGKRIDSPPFTL